MMNSFSKTFALSWLVICFISMTGCSREKTNADIRETVPQQAAQQHSGDLYVKILPEAPTSSDDLQAVFSSTVPVTWRWEKNGLVLENEKTPRLARNHFSQGDTISVIVTAGVKEGRSSVSIANSFPELTEIRFTPDYICSGVEVKAVPKAFDADSDVVGYIYKWLVNGEQINEESPVLQGNRFKKGDILVLEVTPFDSHGSGKSLKSPPFTVPNAPPVFMTTPPETFKGKIYKYDAVARDPDSEAVTYSLASCPKGMTIDSKEGCVTWPVGPNDSGSHTIKIFARDDNGASTFQEYTLNISSPGGVVK